MLKEVRMSNTEMVANRPLIAVSNTSASLNDCESLINRTTPRFFSSHAISREAFDGIEKEMREVLAGKPWLSMYVVAQKVDGLDPGVYRIDAQKPGLECTRKHYH